MENLQAEAGRLSFEKLPVSEKAREQIAGPSLTYAKDVWHRFRRRPTALLGLVIIALLLFFAVAGPFLSPHAFDQQNLSYANLSPFLTATEYHGRYFFITPALKLVEISPSGLLLNTFDQPKQDLMNRRNVFTIGENETLTFSYKVKPGRLVDEEGKDLTVKRTLWNRAYPLGTDQLGRDLMVRLMHGARISLSIAFIAMLVNLIIGVLYGGLSGYLGGMADTLMMRFVEIISTIPLTLYVIMIMVVLKSGLVSIIVALGLVYWVGMARVVRGQILALKQQEFVLAAHTIGCSTREILLRHLIPNTMGTIIVNMTMLIPTAIFVEAFMSFIGLGVAAPMASWGTLCNEALEGMRSSPHQLIFPALSLCLTMFAFNFVGDGLRDALDPRMRQ